MIAWALRNLAWNFIRHIAGYRGQMAPAVTVPEMANYPERRVLAIIGSGETSPTMVTVHRDLLGGLSPGRPRALLLSTPYAFQENAASVSARAERYFAGSVGLQVAVAAGTNPEASRELAPPAAGHAPASVEAAEVAAVQEADWVFAGPGSPSYALAHWRGGPVGAALRERVLTGHGVTVLASAAAATAGRYTLPVYEIYKAGGALRWLPGLDLLGGLGLAAAVIPHYDNTEGGRYDTRHCYLGARRLAVMERELPADAAVLGVDEHTAVLIDVAAGHVEVRGRGALTVRRSGHSATLASGTAIPLAELAALVRGDAGSPGRRRRFDTAAAGPRGPAGPGPDSAAARDAATLPLPEIMAGAARGFGVAAGDRDADAMTTVILSLEHAIGRWEADTDEDQGTEQARLLLRSLIGRLGRAARDGVADPADRLRPAVEPLIELRDARRAEGDFAAADAIRDALAAAGLGVSDTPDGTRWQDAGTGLTGTADREGLAARRGRAPDSLPLHLHHLGGRTGLAVAIATTVGAQNPGCTRAAAPASRGADRARDELRPESR